MFKKKDDIRTFIVIVVVCVLCVIVALLFNNNKNNYDSLEVVDDYDMFFANVSIVNNYLSYVSSGNSEAVSALLEKKYDGDILDNSSKYTALSSFEVSSMKYVQVNKDFIYYVQGKIYNNVYDSVRELVDDSFSIVIIKDTSKNSYSLYPTHDNASDVINSIKWIRIKNNKYNTLGENPDISREKVCAIYFSNYMNYIYNDIGYAYELISEDMKKIYTDKNKYTNYIYKNFSLLSSTADKCNLSISDENNIYTVIDKNGNTYRFVEQSILNYKVDIHLKGIES